MADSKDIENGITAYHEESALNSRKFIALIAIAGGRDLKGTKTNPKNLRTAPQSKDQDLARGNLALSMNVETGNPVRVIRGYKLRSPFAPDEGYRYDGLYTVEKFWFTKGLSGFGVYKFALRRCKDQAPPPWEIASEAPSPSKSSDSGFSDAASCDQDSNDGHKMDSEESNDGHNSAVEEASDVQNDVVEGDGSDCNSTAEESDSQKSTAENSGKSCKHEAEDSGDSQKSLAGEYEDSGDVQKSAD